MTPEEQELWNALLAWRQALIDAGVPHGVVPMPEDLETVSTTPGLTRDMFPALSLRRPEAVLKYAPGILSTLRTARHEIEQRRATDPKLTPLPLSDPASTPTRVPRQVAQTTSIAPPQAPGSRLVEPAVVPLEDGPTQGPPVEDSMLGSDRPAKGRQFRRSGPTGDPLSGNDDDDLRSEGFAPFDIGRVEVAEVPRPGMATLENGIRVTWNPLETDRTVLYRVVTRDDVEVWSPDGGDLVAVTTQATVDDDRPFLTPTRFYSVWANAGTDNASARAAQPRLLAQGVAFARPMDMRLAEDHGTVIASWRVADGVSRVDVVRVPVELAQRRRGYQQEFLLTRAVDRLSYRDTTCEPGAEYEYRLFAVHTDPGTGAENWSDATSRSWRVSTMLTPVEELLIEERIEGNRTLLDLSWPDPPLNEVVIYRTPKQPLAGLTSDNLDVSSLAGAGLSDQHRLLVHPDIVNGRGQLTGIAWPAGWPRVHFTAVSLSGSTARIGRTATRSRTSGIERVRIVQRVVWQLLTFSWPPDATSVSVFSTPPGTTMEDYPSEPLAVLSQADYRRLGGLRLPLPDEGCLLHLVPMSFFQGKKIPGKPTTAAYSGIYRLSYRMTVPEAPAPTGRFGGRGAPVPAPTRRRLEVIGQADRPPDLPVTLTLVMRRDRLPLSVLDAEAVLGSKRIPLPGGFRGDVWTLVDELDVEPLTGCYLRMFAQVDGLAIAMLDPVLETLRP